MFVDSIDLSGIMAGVEALRPGENEAVLLLFAEDKALDIPSLIEALNKQNITFFGGVFPGLIYGNQRKTGGCILKKFRFLIPPFCVSEIADGQMQDLPGFHASSSIEQSTAIILIDGLTSNIYGFLEKLNNLLGGQCNFIGGGAGSISLQSQPCVFTRQGFVADAAVVCVIDKQVTLGVRHGWEKLVGPLVATQTAGNTILELNWKKALEVYNTIVEMDCGVALTPENFAAIAQGYPFGILREKEDDIVRDPLAIGPNGSIICIGEVQPNTVLQILKGRPKALLEAAQKAIHDCGGKTGLPILADGTFVVDCITRALFLEEQFELEMNFIRDNLILQKESQEPFGMLSLGEISSYGDGMLELFNKTIVIGTFH